MVRALALILMTGCIHGDEPAPLAPGETRCTTTHIYGVDRTHCNTGQAALVATVEPEPVVETKDIQPAVQPRKTIEGDFPMYCVLFTGNKVNAGGCFKNVDACEKFRAMDPARSECTERSGAACFNSTDTVTGERRTICFPRIKECDEVLDGQRESPDVTALSSQCGIYRQRKVE